MAYLQENYPQTITNDSLDIDATGGIDDLGFLELTSIDGIQFFNDLTFLYCGNNQLTSLSELPEGLTYLDLDYNQLTSLPELSGDYIIFLFLITQ